MRAVKFKDILEEREQSSVQTSVIPPLRNRLLGFKGGKEAYRKLLPGVFLASLQSRNFCPLSNSLPVTMYLTPRDLFLDSETEKGSSFFSPYLLCGTMGPGNPSRVLNTCLWGGAKPNSGWISRRNSFYIARPLKVLDTSTKNVTEEQIPGGHPLISGDVSSRIHSFNNYLLGINFMPGTGLGAKERRDRALRKFTIT